jgi:hypothetical protein
MVGRRGLGCRRSRRAGHRQHDDADVMVLQRDLHLVAATFPGVYAEVTGTGERLEWDGVTMLDPGPQAVGLNLSLGDGISRCNC